MARQFDMVIRGGLIADGTGGDPFESDLGVRNGRIAAIGQVTGSGREEIDARGKLITPGFIDPHTHYDAQAIWSERLDPSSLHGVTTVVTGNCGVGFAPCRQDDHELLMSVMEGVEEIPGAAMADGLPWTWETFPEYLDAVDAGRHDVDVAVCLPHAALRLYVMGRRGADREPATEADLARMRTLACEAIKAGAVGFSTTRYPIHRTSAGAATPTRGVAETELQAIAFGMRDAGSGVLQPALDVVDTGLLEELELLRRLSANSGRPATFGLAAGPNLGCAAAADEWREALGKAVRANTMGASLTAQMLTRPQGLVLGFHLPAHPFCLCPTFQPLIAVSVEERMRALRRPEIRERLLAEAPDPTWSTLVTLGRSFEHMFRLVDPPDYEPPPEASVLARARRLGVSPAALAYDLMLEGDGTSLLVVWLTAYQERVLDTVYDMLDHPNVVPGLSDAGAHLGMICDGSYTTHLLTYGTRDRQGRKMSIGRAVQAMTAAPARAGGLLDRGVLTLGYRADLNVIDYDRLRLFAPEAAYDLPAGRCRLMQRATGFDLTVVAGQVTYRDGEPTGRLPGRLVRGAASGA